MPFDDDQGLSSERDPPLWVFGSRVAARNVELGRKAYRRYAEAAEYALNAFEATASRASGDLGAVAVGMRETVLHLSEHGFAAAREVRGRLREMDERGLDALQANVARGRADVRDIALRGQVAADTNVRACFDCVEQLAQASTMQDFVAVQTSFVWTQWQRSLRQAFDLQTMTIDLWRKAVSPRAV